MCVCVCVCVCVCCVYVCVCVCARACVCSNQMDLSPAVCREALASMALRKQWDDYLDAGCPPPHTFAPARQTLTRCWFSSSLSPRKGQIVEQLDPATCVLYARTVAQWPTACRETLVIDQKELLNDGTIVAVAVSIDSHPKVAKDGSAVRAVCKYSITKFEPLAAPGSPPVALDQLSIALNSERCRVTSVQVTNPGGGLPEWIRSMINTKTPLALESAHKLVRSNDKIRVSAPHHTGLLFPRCLALASVVVVEISRIECCANSAPHQSPMHPGTLS